MKPSIIFLAKVINCLNFVKFHFRLVDTAIIREDANLQKVYIPIFLYLKKKASCHSVIFLGFFFRFVVRRHQEDTRSLNVVTDARSKSQ